MTVALLVVALSDVLVAALLVRVTAAAADGRLDRNGFAGIRTPATGASDAAWRAGHAAALPTARLVALVFGAGAALGVVLWLLGWPETGFWVAFAPNVLLLLMLWPLLRRANAAARAVSDGVH
ncbi:SdpI family protein [Phycicoccus sp. BSK3Z-2]|uniref:SdpI family protein n=1 Tax=Phycicoccus avicenniae TaxID=2828860 RepID=A0A941I0K3_9MICO|nr:SdpI family protein [Phycicoccus avicenniae]MBR7744005.1 SdpI family protein [Phycicoccus avicenniae]